MRSGRNLLILAVLGGVGLLALVMGFVALISAQRTTAQTINGVFLMAVGIFCALALYKWIRKGMPE